MDAHALAIGHLCIAWANLEATVNHFMGELLGIGGSQFSDVLSANVDLRQKIQIVKGIGFLRKLSPEWFERLQGALDVIDNVHRPERNRYVHDDWRPKAKWTLRERKRVAIRRRQSRKPLEISTFERAIVDPEQIWGLVERITESQDVLFALYDEFVELWGPGAALP